MNKYIIIDSVARSGTTLLSAILNSQKKTTTVNGIISGAEFLLYSRNEYWSQEKCLKKNDMNYLKNIVSNSINSDNGRLLKGQSKEYWLTLLNNVKTEDDFVTEYYDPILKSYDSTILGLRYNQTIWYFDKWVSKSKNNYWLTIIRNPYDRSRSNMITHSWSPTKCIRLTDMYGKKLMELQNHPQFIYIYYEDLVKDPENVIKEIYKKIGVKLENIELSKLIGADNKLYKNQGSNVKQNKGDHRKGEDYQGIHSNSVGKAKEIIKEDSYLSFGLNNIINKYPIYNRYK